jgi:hypothetical protein
MCLFDFRIKIKINTSFDQTWKGKISMHYSIPIIHFQLFYHYNNKGLFCDPNIVANHNSLQTLKLLQYHNIRTRTIASPSQLPNLTQSQNFSDYNCFYTLFAINIALETICNKPITATT